MSFKTNKYCIIRQAIPKDLATFVANYFSMKKQVMDTCRRARYISPYETLLGEYEGAVSTYYGKDHRIKIKPCLYLCQNL